MTSKSQIPASSGPGYKFMRKSPSPTKPAGGLFPKVPDHNRGKDGKTK